MKSIQPKTLAKWANLSPRRIAQLIEEKRLPAPVDGEMPMPEAVQALFRHYQGTAEQLREQRLRKTTLEAELLETEVRQATGGDLLPVSIIEQAAAMAAGKFRNLASELYVLGIPGVRGNGEWDPAVERLGKQFAQDFTGYARQWAERQAEIAKEQEEATI